MPIGSAASPPAPTRTAQRSSKPSERPTANPPLKGAAQTAASPVRSDEDSGALSGDDGVVRASRPGLPPYASAAAPTRPPQPNALRDAADAPRRGRPDTLGPAGNRCLLRAHSR